ncbi:MAG: helix-turn-helix transcriptional regulator [Clostridia bacterium]|nr:helix-turn-helix transcriptional regulator [Clostridia bacterium]
MINYERITLMLKERGLSQSYVSDKLGMSRGYLKDCKRKNLDIPEDRLQLIAEILVTTTAYLRNETDDPYPRYPRPKGMSNELWEKVRRNPQAIGLLSIMLDMTPKQLKMLETVVLMMDDEMKKGN